jgi:DNA-binding MarR family transcriptional regulator
LRDRFDITLPRFDMMAQLDREPKGLKMSELSRRLMVTGGNVTGLTDQLVAEGLVMRRGIPGDRRAYNIRLTPKGKRQFDAMAVEHEAWIVELLAEVPAATREAMHESLAQLKIALATRLASRSEPHPE